MDELGHKGSFRIKHADSMFLHSNNKKIINLEVADIPLVNKHDYKKQEFCQVCFIQFSKTRRQHHCRICADAVCSSCSPSSINKQRCCDVCALKHSNPNKEAIKQKILHELKGIALLYTQNKIEIEEELKKSSSQIKSPEELAQAEKISQEKIASMTERLEELRSRKQAIYQETKSIEQTM